MAECNYEKVGLGLSSVALLISVSINVVFCIRRRANLCTKTCEGCLQHITEGGSMSQEEGHHFHNLDHHEQQENPHDNDEQQESPIYGNISTERRDSAEVCYEMMTLQHVRDFKKASEADLNYASLDLKLAKKHKKKQRHQQGYAQGQNKLQDQLPAHLTPPSGSPFLDMEADIDANLPPRDTSTMVSHSSIYLNSQQIAQETEEMEREWGVDNERESLSWQGIQRGADGRMTMWNGERQREGGDDRADCSNGDVCTQLSEVKTIQNGTDHFIRSFGPGGLQ